jgi:hypothetical protein
MALRSPKFVRCDNYIKLKSLFLLKYLWVQIHDIWDLFYQKQNQQVPEAGRETIQQDQSFMGGHDA